MTTTTDTPPQDHNEASFNTQGRWVLFATISASGMAFVMQSALNVAIPAIQTDLGASGAEALWIVNAYQLLLSGLLLVGGSLGDHYGRKRVYITGIVIFVLASVLCGLAPNTLFLIGGRALQGIGGALMVPGSLAIISAYFDERTRGRAIGTWSAFVTGASILAPSLGGFLADLGLWRVILFLTIPLALAALYALLNHVPESKDEDASAQLDYTGGLLITFALIGIVYSMTEIGRTRTLNDPLIALGLGGGLISLALFFVVERRSDHPLVNLNLFQSRTFSGVNLMTLFLYGALSAALTFLPWNLQQIQGYSGTFSGLAVIPMTILLTLMSPWAGGLIDKYGPRPPLIGGPIIVGLGFAAFALPGVTAGPSAFWWTYLPPILLIGIGMGITVAPLTTAALGSVPQQNSGIASAINNLMSRASGALAVAIMGGFALVSFSGLLAQFTLEMPLTTESREQLLVNSQDLGNTAMPESVSEANAEAVRQAIDWAFVQMFRQVMLIAAILCWISAAMAAWLVEAKLEPPPALSRSGRNA